MELSNEELIEIIKRRDKKIKRQGKKITNLAKGFRDELPDNEYEKLILELKMSEHELRTMRDEHIEEIEELKKDISFLLLEDL